MRSRTIVLSCPLRAPSAIARLSRRSISPAACEQHKRSAQNAYRAGGYDRNGAKRDGSFGHHQQLGSVRHREGIGRRKGRGIGESQKQVIDKSGRPILELFAFGETALLLRKNEIARGFE